jgi:hypothetical protein
MTATEGAVSLSGGILQTVGLSVNIPYHTEISFLQGKFRSSGLMLMSFEFYLLVRIFRSA